MSSGKQLPPRRDPVVPLLALMCGLMFIAVVVLIFALLRVLPRLPEQLAAAPAGNPTPSAPAFAPPAAAPRTWPTAPPRQPVYQPPAPPLANPDFPPAAQMRPAAPAAPGTASPPYGAPRALTMPTLPSAPPTTTSPGPQPRGPQDAESQDSRNFDRYIQWLKKIEAGRARLRATGEAGGDVNGSLAQIAAAAERLQDSIQRTRPAVPSDCLRLDQAYRTAIAYEVNNLPPIIRWLQRGDRQQAHYAAQQAFDAEQRQLAIAEQLLEAVLAERRAPAAFRIETGPAASILVGF